VDQDELQSSLEEVRALNPHLDEVLLCSPFNKTQNFGGRLTPELFFKKLFIETEQVKALDQELSEALSSRFLQNNRIIFLEGYSGTGKTTFVQYFLKEHPEFESVYIDFYPRGHSFQPVDIAVRELADKQSKFRMLEDQLHTDDEKRLLRELEQDLSKLSILIRDTNQVNEQTHPIATVIRFHLTTPRAEITDFLYYLKSNKEALQDYFEHFGKTLAELEPARAENNLHSLWEKTTLRDTLIIFFLYYIQRYKKLADPNRTFLIFFDNLDIIDLAYLTPFFKESFANALGLFSEMLQDRNLFPVRLDFEHRFKFVFCLREANSSTINVHLEDTLFLIATNIHLRVGFGSELYQSALEKRLEFHSELTAENQIKNEDAAKAIKMLSAFAKDPFFIKVFVPLYNSDFRKLTHTLFQVTLKLLKTDSNPGGLSFAEVGDSFAAHEDDKYGVRGALLFEIVQKLRNENFVKNYFFVPENAAGNSGWCQPTRMLLTLLLNKSKLKRGEDVITIAKPFTEVPLGVIVEEAQDLYSVTEIIETLVEVFLAHQRSWVHLITFTNRPVESIDAFRPELEDLSYSGKLPSSWFDVFITLNPSGYNYVKYVVVHFEFYSSLCGNTSALFTQGVKRVGGKPHVFEFEETIQRVQRLVRRSAESMRQFFEVKFERGREMFGEDYLKSDFAFKHFKHLAPADEGLFHATRVVSQHIAYVDHFRLWLLNQNIDAETKIIVNRKLIAFLQRYLDILTPWRDGFLSAREEIHKNITSYKDDGPPAPINPNN
jgi:hypothetical protein